MTKQLFASVLVGAQMTRKKYQTAKVLVNSEVKNDEGYSIGIGQFDSGEKFLFRLNDDGIGESRDVDDYGHFGIPLSFKNDDPQLVAAQLRELADWLETQ